MSEQTLAPTKAQMKAATKEEKPQIRDRSRFWRLFLPLALYLIFTLVPFYWMINFALREAGSKSLFPMPVSLHSFDTIWNTVGFSTFLVNSFIVSIATLICTTILAVLGGYAVARYKFRGKGAFMLALLCTQFIPGAMMLIPLFEIFRTIGLLNSLTGLVIADTAFQLPLSLMLMSGFIRNVPMEIEEAAMVDGCSRFRAFFAVVLPLLKPALVAVGSFAFIGAWNNFLFAVMFINKQDRFTVPVGLSYMLGEFSVDFGSLAAGGVLAAIPVVLVFAVVQRFLVQGMSSGAVKG